MGCFSRLRNAAAAGFWEGRFARTARISLRPHLATSGLAVAVFLVVLVGDSAAATVTSRAANRTATSWTGVRTTPRSSSESARCPGPSHGGGRSAAPSLRRVGPLC